jgi:hypothetical protein
MNWYGNEDAGDLEMMGRADYEGEMNEQRHHEARLAYAKAFAIYSPRGEVLVECCLDKPALLETDAEAVYDEEWGLFYCDSTCFDREGMHNGDGYCEPQEDFGADLGIHCSDPLDRYMD